MIAFTAVPPGADTLLHLNETLRGAADIVQSIDIPPGEALGPRAGSEPRSPVRLAQISMEFC